MMESLRLEISPASKTDKAATEQKQLRYKEPFVPFPAAELTTALEALNTQTPAFDQLFFDRTFFQH